MFNNPFSFKGRIRRTEFGLSMIIYVALLLCLVWMEQLGTTAALLSLFLYIPIIWFLLAQGAKRCHDRNRSGWYQIIPFYNLVMLFGEGDSNANDYGSDPKGFSEEPSYIN